MPSVRRTSTHEALAREEAELRASLRTAAAMVLVGCLLLLLAWLVTDERVRILLAGVGGLIGLVGVVTLAYARASTASERSRRRN